MPAKTLTPARTLLLLIIALLGFAHVAFLPPFEGFDETAHLSYIQQIADTGALPKLGRDKLSTDVESYTGPYGAQGALTYHAFFANGAAAPPARTHQPYAPGNTANWEAQHPPLYYLLLTPFYKAAHDAGWNTLFLSLRSVSWAMAFAGFAIGAIASLRALDQTHAPPSASLIVLGWPILFPQFFPEMARLGNDSLCLLFMGISWALLLRVMTRRDVVSAVLLGLALGAGLWTKAFFVAIGAGIGASLLYGAWRAHDKQLLRSAAVAMVVTAVGGGGWYVAGVLGTGSTEFLQADTPVDFWGTIAQTFDPGVFIKGLLSMAASVVWSGSWSFVKLGPLTVIPVLVLGLMMVVEALRAQKRPALFPAAVFIAGLFIAGLVIHLLTQLTRDNYGNGTPGWYLHILAAPLALVLATGWRPRWPFLVLTAYAVVFHIACWLLQLSYFSGCAIKTPGEHRIRAVACLIVPENLALISWPILGTALLILAGVCGFLYAIMQKREATA